MESNNSVPPPPDVTPPPPSIPSVEKKVGFVRPTLIIPPPRISQNSPRVFLNVPEEGPYRKPSLLMFDHIHQLRDLGLSTAKTSLGAGEKCAYWFYNKVKDLSKKWFTHCFLTIVLVIYTVGGALSFKAIEEPLEESVQQIDIWALRQALIGELTNLSRSMPYDNQTEQWKKQATDKMGSYVGQVIEDQKIKAFIKANNGPKVWTIWNSVVFCATIYSTIATPKNFASSYTPRGASRLFLTYPKNIVSSRKPAIKFSYLAMESEKACQNVKPDETSEENVINNNNNDVPKVVDEGSAQMATDNAQEAIEVNNSNKLPADDDKEGQESRAPDLDVPPPVVVRKKQRQKRRIQHGGAKRESTPIRYLGDASGDEMTGVSREEVKEDKSPHVNGKEWSSSSTSENISRQGSFRKDQAKKGSISEIAQQELVTLYNKTKKSLTTAAQRGRERFRKYEQQLSKRSQSAPQKFVEELQESLEKVQQIEYPLRRKYSDSSFPVTVNGSFRSVSPPQILRGRRCTKRAATPKIIEVLDPKTSNVVQRKSIGRVGGIGRHIVSLKVASIKDILRNFQIHKQQFHKDYTKLKQTFRKCCLELFLIMILCGLGGIMFKFTEGTFETYYKCGVKRVKRDFIDLLWLKSHNLREDDWKSLARSRLRGFEEELHNAHEAGMTDYSGMRSWSFLNGIIYCLTIVTTIGYGHMFPKTTTGRALTIVYALIGIPLFLIALTDFGKLFTRGIKFVWSFIRRLYYTGSCRNVRKNSGVDDIFKGAQNLYDYATFKRPSLFDPNTPNLGDSESQHQATDTPTTPAISNYEIDDEFNLPISVALFILVSYIFCGAVMYMVIEKWHFFEAFYFVFISMSTIGFGDYVPRDQVFMIVSIVYLVFGLALMSMCINVVQAKLSDTFKKASSKIGATMGIQVDEDDSVVVASAQVIEEITPVQVETTNERSSDK